MESYFCDCVCKCIACPSCDQHPNSCNCIFLEPIKMRLLEAKWQLANFALYQSSFLYYPCYTSAHQGRTTDGLQRHVSSHTSPVYRLTGDLQLPLPSLPTRKRSRAAARGYFGSSQTRASIAAKTNACHILKPPTIFVWRRLGSRCTTCC